MRKKRKKLQKRKNTHTHLLRIANRIVKLEYILRAKQSGSKPDRKKKVQARFELPSSIVPLPHKWCTTITTITLKENWKLNLPFLVSDCDSSAVKNWKHRHAGSWLSRSPFTKNWTPARKLALKSQVRWVDQTQYPMIVIALLSAVPQSCRTPLHET
jgi:hypothetical protein